MVCAWQVSEQHRGTSLARKRTPLGPYRRPMPRVLGGWAFSYGRGTPVTNARFSLRVTCVGGGGRAASHTGLSLKNVCVWHRLTLNPEP